MISFSKTYGPTRQSASNLSFQSRILVLVVAVFLLLPVIGGLFIDHGDRSRFENRTLAQFPSLSELIAPNRFFAKFDKFTGDHLGFAVFFNRIYAKSSCFAFKRGIVENVSVTQNGFVFLTSHFADSHNDAIEQLCLPAPDPETTRQYYSALRHLDTGINSFGHRMIFGVAITKPVLYPEQLPEDIGPDIKRRCRMFFSNNIIKTIREKAGEDGIIFHYPFGSFMAHRDIPHFYPKENFHWNGYSAHLFSYTLFKKLGVENGVSDSGKCLSTTEADLKIMGFERDITVWSYPYDAYCIEGGAGDPRLHYMKKYYSRMNDFSYYETENPLQKKDAILISDSFGKFTAKHLARGYATLRHFNVSHLLEEEKVDFFQHVLTLNRGMDIIFLFFDGTVVNGYSIRTMADIFDKLACPG